MIRYLSNQEIDKDKWDKCINDSINSYVYAYSWYLDIVSTHWDALVEDDYLSVFPLTYSIKYGISYLYQPFFTQQLGIFSENIISENLVTEYFKKLTSKYRFIEINMNYKNLFIPEEFAKIKNTNLELNLNNTYENIYKNYSTNAKRNLNKAQKRLLSYQKSIDADLIINLFRQNKGLEISTLKVNHFLVLKKLVKACIDRNMAEISGVNDPENKLCAGAIFIKNKSGYIFLFSGSDGQAKEAGAMFYLIDTFIKEHSGKDMNLDFEGSNNKNLADFYRGFGAKEQNYYLIRKNSLPLHIKPVFSFYKWFKKQ